MGNRQDSLGDRMKQDYENRTRFLLPRRTYTVIRVDGKAFHTYTRACRRPYDEDLMAAMDMACLALCSQIQGAQIGYVQSDEISVIATDFGSVKAEAWFDGNIQKIVSISASIATTAFNDVRRAQGAAGGALFDSRAFTIPDPVEVENYMIWRQQDATRNSISMTAQAYFSQRELEGKTTDQMQEVLWQRKGVNWNDLPAGFKRGRCAVRQTLVGDVAYIDSRTNEERTALGVERRVWEIEAPPVFTQERSWLTSRL